MLVKILRSERLLDAVRTFVKDHLGILYVSTPPVDLQEIFKESNPKVPIIFILSPGNTTNAVFTLSNTVVWGVLLNRSDDSGL